ncbi:hypothetical protein P43SY_003778 [Pythium insidiosum]|uniref:Uncharacterized protein n=1 Tax=Pythium insidiosum TaxID=114742 RepID=A0AAD5Q3V2_PYTIN|nr:hypothetical protein P43SY_003778 [Pythium insidiosum]
MMEMTISPFALDDERELQEMLTAIDAIGVFPSCVLPGGDTLDELLPLRFPSLGADDSHERTLSTDAASSEGHGSAAHAPLTAPRGSLGSASKARRKTVSSTERARKELVGLRLQADELAATLRHLRGARESRMRKQRERRTEAEKQALALADAFWERMAGQQRVARRKAVTENLRLKALLGHYNKLTQSVLKALDAQKRIQAAVSATLSNLEKAYQQLDDAPAGDIYVAMIQGLSARYHMTNDVMQRSHFSVES